eukprot:685951-Pyramimonas_sp.AAC.1
MSSFFVSDVLPKFQKCSQVAPRGSDKTECTPKGPQLAHKMPPKSFPSSRHYFDTALESPPTCLAQSRGHPRWPNIVPKWFSLLSRLPNVFVRSYELFKRTPGRRPRSSRKPKATNTLALFGIFALDELLRPLKCAPKSPQKRLRQDQILGPQRGPDRTEWPPEGTASGEKGAPTTRPQRSSAHG